MIYIHVPFCHRKCTYCAFYSKVESGKWKVEDYVDVLLAEMDLRKGEQSHPIRTVYFGGGTPSILTLEQLARIVEGLRRCFDLSRVEEVTLEANPEDLTPQYLDGLRALHFFNRLSIGVQSLDDRVLRRLNRRHTAAQAIASVENARRAGFGNISVDFIFGIGALGALESLGNLGFLGSVTHISAYVLTVEPCTALAVQVEQGRVSLPGEDEVVRQYHALHSAFEAAGFRQYEVSNYARPGFESRHNSRYWDRTPYLGLGPGAHSFDGQRRRWNGPMEADIGRWGAESEETLTEADAYNELLMTALRTVRGLPAAALKEVTMRQLQPYVDCNWLVYGDGYYRPTPEGLLHADGMAAELFI